MQIVLGSRKFDELFILYALFDNSELQYCFKSLEELIVASY